MTRTVGDVLAEIAGCTVLDRDGEPCGKPGSPRLPVGVCEHHALTITRAVLALGDGTVTFKEDQA